MRQYGCTYRPEALQAMMEGMATTVVGAAARRIMLRGYIAVAVAVPAVALVHRIITGELSIPWGWQMFS